MTADSPVHEIVILGGSFAGLFAAHHLFKTVIPSLKQTKREYKVTILTNSSKFFHKVSAPRALINPDLQSLDLGLIDIAPAFKQYGDAFNLVLGYATSVDPIQHIVTYDGTEGNTSGSLGYNSLIIATGANFDDPIWGVSGGWENLEAAYKEIHSKLPSANSILIAGGGAAGVETAGEIAHRFPNGKDVTLLSGSRQLLPNIRNHRFGHDAEQKLTKKGIKVVHNVRAKTWTKEADGTTTVLHDNGEKMKVDLFVASTGNKINSGFVPTSWLSETPKNGTIKTDPRTLRLNVPDVRNVYIFGSAGSYSDGGLIDIMMAYKALGESFRVDQLSASGDLVKQKTFYKKFDNKDIQLVPIGPKDGVCIVKGWRLPAMVCVMVKSKDFMIGSISKVTEGIGL